MKANYWPWLLDPERRGHLIDVYRKDGRSDLPGHILTEMNNQGLLHTFSDGSQRLSRKGRLLAYNIEEYRIQLDKIFSVLDKLNIFPGSVVLDVGCGGGQTLLALVDRQPSLAVGMDFDLLNLEIAQSFTSTCSAENVSFAFQQGDGNALPFKDGSVDFLICRGVLHLLNIGAALQEMARVLKPGGRIYIHALGFGAFMEHTRKSNFREKFYALFAIFNGIFYALTGSADHSKV